MSLGALISLAYLATIGGPLRVDTDSAYLLQLGVWFADGHGLDIGGVPSFRPGYPVIVGALVKLGIALASLAAALALQWVVAERISR